MKIYRAHILPWNSSIITGRSALKAAITISKHYSINVIVILESIASTKPVVTSE